MNNEGLSLPSWHQVVTHKADSILRSWVAPSKVLELALLQRRNIEWYEQFKKANGRGLRAFLISVCLIMSMCSRTNKKQRNEKEICGFQSVSKYTVEISQ